MSIGLAFNTLAYTPWSYVNGNWYSSDGKTIIKDAVEKGVTVSKYQNTQGDINWKQVASDDISFAMIRLGYYNDIDPYFDENMTNAEAAGIETGVIFYGNAVNTYTAKREADYVLGQIKEYKVSYPVGYDISSASSVTKNLSKQDLTDIINVFCDEIEEAGYSAVVYGDYDFLTKDVYYRQIPYDIWYCRYDISNTFQDRTIWQCTDHGSVNGISGNVCLEFSFEDYSHSSEDTGWRTINGMLYYFQNFKMVKNRTMSIDGALYLFDSSGNTTMISSGGPGID